MVVLLKIKMDESSTVKCFSLRNWFICHCLLAVADGCVREHILTIRGGVLDDISATNISQLMRLWYLSQRRPAKAQASLRIRTVSPEPSLFAHMNYGRSRRVQPKFRHLAPLDGCTCAFEERVYDGRKVP